MKYLIILLVIFISSCDNDDIKVKNPQQETTLEIKQLADKDSVTYKAVYLNNTLYLYNSNTEIVDIKLVNATGDKDVFALIVMLLSLLLILFAIILSKIS